MRYPCLKLVGVIFSLLLGFPIPTAMGLEGESVQEIEPVVVIGQSSWSEQIRREASSISRVPQTDIQQSRTYNLEDVFQSTPGVFFQTRSGANDGKLSIRGTNLASNFNTWGVTLLINGIPMGTSDGFSNFEAIDLQAVQGIEVYKGAAALRFGGNTMGGAINFLMRDGSQLPLLKANIQGGSFGFYNVNLSSGKLFEPVTLWGEQVRVEYAISGTANGQHGFRTNSQHDALRLLTNVGVEIGANHYVRLFVANASIASDFPGLLTKEEMEDDPTQAGAEIDTVVNPLVCGNAEPCRHAEYTQFHYIGVGYSNSVLSNQQFTISPFYQYWYHDLSRAQKVILMNHDMGTELRHVWSGKIGNHQAQLTMGFSPKYGETQTNVGINDFGNRGSHLQKRFTKTVNLGGYVEGQLDLLKDLTLVLGSRLVHSRRRGTVTNFSPPGTSATFIKANRVFSAALPKIGMLYRPTSTAQIFGNVSRVYEPPINIQLIQALNVNALPPADAFLNLKAPRGWQFEVGYRGRTTSGDVSWDLTGYDLELNKEILVTELTIAGVGEVPTYGNARKTRHSGIEVGGRAVVGRNLLPPRPGGTADQLSVRAAYTWGRNRFMDEVLKVSGGTQVRDAKKGNTIPGIPDHWITGEVRYDHPTGFWLAPNILWSPQGYFVDFANTLKNPPFFVLNLKAGWQCTPYMRWYLEGRNLTNQNYAGSIVAGGLNQASASGTRAFLPSAPLSIFSGLEFTWD
ncbi:MAG: TonB-dependent receptor [Nitrospirales bacterium]|nr:TonB-dependent receptor [Nitrospirales bacterium]